MNNGVEETPPSKPSFNGLYSTEAGPDPNEFHVDLEGTNVGFKHWHPMPVTQNGGRLSGQGDMGGVWEWTSTVLEKHEGFEPMALYPVYTGRPCHHNKEGPADSGSRLLRYQAQCRPRWILGNSPKSRWAQNTVSIYFSSTFRSAADLSPVSTGTNAATRMCGQELDW